MVAPEPPERHCSECSPARTSDHEREPPSIRTKVPRSAHHPWQIRQDALIELLTSSAVDSGAWVDRSRMADSGRG